MTQPLSLVAALDALCDQDDPELLDDPRTRCPDCDTHITDTEAARFDYFCPQCGEHLDALYRAEHLNPTAAQTMTRADIEREYAAAGRPFSPLPPIRQDWRLA